MWGKRPKPVVPSNEEDTFELNASVSEPTFTAHDHPMQLDDSMILPEDGDAPLLNVSVSDSVLVEGPKASDLLEVSRSEPELGILARAEPRTVEGEAGDNVSQVKSMLIRQYIEKLKEANAFAANIVNGQDMDVTMHTADVSVGRRGSEPEEAVAYIRRALWDCNLKKSDHVKLLLARGVSAEGTIANDNDNVCDEQEFFVNISDGRARIVFAKEKMQETVQQWLLEKRPSKEINRDPLLAQDHQLRVSLSRTPASVDCKCRLIADDDENEHDDRRGFTLIFIESNVSIRTAALISGYRSELRFKMLCTVDPVPRARLISRPVLVTGPAGSGKSVLVKQLLHRISSDYLRTSTLTLVPMSVSAAALGAFMESKRLFDPTSDILGAFLRHACPGPRAGLLLSMRQRRRLLVVVDVNSWPTSRLHEQLEQYMCTRLAVETPLCVVTQARFLYDDNLFAFFARMPVQPLDARQQHRIVQGFYEMADDAAEAEAEAAVQSSDSDDDDQAASEAPAPMSMFSSAAMLATPVGASVAKRSSKALQYLHGSGAFRVLASRPFMLQVLVSDYEANERRRARDPRREAYARMVACASSGSSSSRRRSRSSGSSLGALLGEEAFAEMARAILEPGSARFRGDEMAAFFASCFLPGARDGIVRISSGLASERAGETLLALVSTLPSNVQLDFGGGGVSARALSGWGAALRKWRRLHTVVVSIDLSHNDLRAHDLRLLAEEVVAGQKALRSLVLAHNQISTGSAASGNGVTNGISALADVIAEHHSLTFLDISHNRVPAAGARVVADALRHNDTLLELKAGHNEVGARGAEALAGALKNNATLRSLDVAGNGIGESMQEVHGSWEEFRVVVSQFSTSADGDIFDRADFHKFIVDGLRWREEDEEEAFAFFSEEGVIRGGTTLKVDDLVEYYKLAAQVRPNDVIEDFKSLGLLNAGAYALADAVRMNRSLTALDVSANKIGDDGTRRICEALLVEDSVLETLTLGSAKSPLVLRTQDLKGMTAAAAAIDLSLRGLGVNECVAVGVLIGSNHRLTDMNLSSNKLTGNEGGRRNTGVALLSHGLSSVSSTLTRLNLSNNALKLEGAKLVCAALKGAPLLKYLNLSRNGIGAEGARSLAAVVRSIPTLEHIDVADNDFDVSSTGVQALFQACAESRSLAKLTFSGSGGGTAATLDAAMVEADFGFRSMGSTGAIVLAATLNAKCERLTDLDLSGNHLGAEGAALVCGMMAANRTVTALSLHDNNLRPEGAESVAKMLRINQTMTSLDLSSNMLCGVAYTDVVDTFGKAKRQEFYANGSLDIFAALTTNAVLASLSLAFNVLSTQRTSNDNVGIELGKALAKSNLESLNVRGTFLSDAAMASIAMGLQDNEGFARMEFDGDKDSRPMIMGTALTSLSFKEGQLGISGAAIVAAMLTKCANLTCLVFGDTAEADASTGKHQSSGEEGAEDDPMKEALTVREIKKIRQEVLGASIEYGTQEYTLEFRKRIGLLLEQKSALSATTSETGQQKMKAEKASSSNASGAQPPPYPTPCQLHTTSVAADLHGVRLEVTGATVLASFVACWCTSLRELDISGTSIGSEGAARIAQLLLTSSSLQVLNLAANNIEAEGATALGTALKSTKHLRSLNLSANLLYPVGVYDLAQGLSSNTSLESLDLSSTELVTTITIDAGPGYRRGETVDYEGAACAVEQVRSDGRAVVVRTVGLAGLMAVLWAHPSLASLRIDDNNVHGQACECVVEALPRMRSLRELSMLGSQCDREEALAEVVLAHASLQSFCRIPLRELKADSVTTLDLTKIRIGVSGALILSKLLGGANSLRALGLSSTALVQKRTVDREKFFEKSVGGATFLEDDYRGITSLCAAISHHPSITVLDVSSNKLTDSAKHVLEMLRTNQVLTSVNLLANQISADDAKSFIDFRKKNARLQTVCGINPAQKELDLGSSGLNYSCFLMLIAEVQNNSVLEVLNVLGNKPTPEQIHALIAIRSKREGFKSLCGIRRGQTVLDLSHRNLDENGALVLSNDLLFHKDNLQQLDISGNPLMGRSGEEEAGIIALASALGRCWNLSRLRFSGAWHGEVVVLDTRLVEVDLKGKGLGRGGALLLSVLLPRCEVLKRLDVADNGLWAAGGRHIADALAATVPARDEANEHRIVHKHIPLQALNIANNDLGATGATHLANALTLNPHLKGLNIAKNFFQLEGSKQFVSALRVNTALECVTFGCSRSLTVDCTSTEGDFSGALQTPDSLIFGHLLSRCCTMTSLHLCGVCTTAEAAKHIAAGVAMMPALESFSCRGKALKNSKRIVATATADTLDCSKDVFLGVIGVILLCAFLPKCTALKTLNLSNNVLTKGALKPGYDGSKLWHYYVNLSAMQSLCGALRSLRRLTQLCVANNGIYGETLQLLASVLADVPSLRHLDVSENKLVDESRWVDLKEFQCSTKMAAGCTVQYKGKPCIISTIEHEDGTAKVWFVESLLSFCGAIDSSQLTTLVFHGFGAAAGRTIELNVSSGEVNLASKKLTSPTALVLAAFLPKCYGLDHLVVSARIPDPQQIEIENAANGSGNVKLIWKD